MYFPAPPRPEGGPVAVDEVLPLFTDQLKSSVVLWAQSQRPLSKVHASTSKSARAEPVAALYEQGRIAHVRGLSALERQMTQMTVKGYVGPGSPDRVDALVWALSELLIAPAAGWKKPRLRAL